jgi:hypothetical protein
VRIPENFEGPPTKAGLVIRPRLDLIAEFENA